jgi:hypothetical protein
VVLDHAARVLAAASQVPVAASRRALGGPCQRAATSARGASMAGRAVKPTRR